MKKLKKRLMKIIFAIIILAIAMFLPIERVFNFNLSSENIANIKLILFLAAYIVAGGDVVKEAVHNIFNGQVFDENFLMTVATVGAFLVSEYPEAVAVMIFYQIGELFQSYAVDKSRKSIADLMDIRPDYANVKKADGTIEKMDPFDVKIDDIIVVKPGERVALDGVVINGAASLDVSALTGESLLREVETNDNIISGSINKNGLIEIKVEKEAGESTVSKILDLVENASDKKTETENFVTKFARYYTPIVCILALLLAVIPPILLGGNQWSIWIYRALSFLVISCPCALVISVPLSFFGGLGGASSNGVLIKGSNYMETLANCKTIVFDKTGTLTKGVFKVNEINVEKDIEERMLIEYAALAETFSSHPIGLSIKEYYYSKYSGTSAQLEKKVQNGKFFEIAGHGTKLTIDNIDIMVGNKKLFESEKIDINDSNSVGTVVYVSADGKYIGNIIISDQIKEDSKKAISTMKGLGIKSTVMLTGDKLDIGEKVGNSLGIDKVFSELLPADKVEKLEAMLKGMGKNEKLAFVGDGINDAPVLARADVGIAMGGLGSDAAIEAADIVLMDDNPLGICKAIKIARKTMNIVRENIIFAIGVKVLVLILAALGFATMWAAVFADVGVAVIAIINALRALRMPK